MWYAQVSSYNIAMHLVDTHCHLDDTAFDADRDEVLRHCRELGVDRIVIPAVTRSGWDALLNLCAHHPELAPALGLHPVYIEQHQQADLDRLAQYLENPAVVAVGEIGLDFLIDNPDKEKQEQFFDAQLDLAKQADLPVILHVRKAHDQVLGYLRKKQLKGGIAHAFNGSLEQARHYINLGFKLGFGGMLTYERSSKLRRLARELPLDSIVLETDSPDLTVSQHRGERNSPEYLPFCLQALSEVREMDPAEAAKRTTGNALSVLNLHLPGTN
ncbi:MAG: TatD family hydrolase [Acidiferrobacterales bacterium]|jgi:TatD DNase family protein|nr:TatD family hydrolase [Acidiferrobacterales bacterium]